MPTEMMSAKRFRFQVGHREPLFHTALLLAPSFLLTVSIQPFGYLPFFVVLMYIIYSLLFSQGECEIELSDDLKQLSFYSIETGDTILLRW